MMADAGPAGEDLDEAALLTSSPVALARGWRFDDRAVARR
jgi:hypothetical protein